MGVNMNDIITEGPPSALPPFPSPSLSIVSLLNPTPSSENQNFNDYFSQDTFTTDTEPSPPPPSRLTSSASPALVFGNGGAGASGENGERGPSASSLGGQRSTLSHLTHSDQSHNLSPNPSSTPSPSSSGGGGETRPRSSKRPRTADSHNDEPQPPPPLPPAPVQQQHHQSVTPPITMLERPQPSPLEPSIFNVEPIDEFTREVADWLWGFCASLDWDVLEIEAKVGIMIDTRMRGRERVKLPVPIETILMDDSGLRFESNMTVVQHKAYNKLLNSRVEESASPSYPFAPIRYSHTREIDTFHESTNPTGFRTKVRVTTDQKDPNRLRCIEKTRVADMNIFSPKRKFDWRISVNLEQPAPIATSPPTLTRYKDRISYSHQLFQVDLTQVTSDRPTSTGTLHELEVEFRDARILMQEARKESKGEENGYLEMVQCFLNNMRMLIRNAEDP